MSNKIFLDSSILVEWAKKTQPDLFNHLLRSSFDLFISQIILSEFTYYWLAVGGGKAPVTLKRDGTISDVLRLYNPAGLLSKLKWLDADKTIIPIHLEMMEKYNLLPNDALILATCKLNGIEKIASYDADFASACLGEAIQLIRSVSDVAL
ncbi:type II toxin-antitoxin system VapC family toxin [Spirosoma radiotolerans]|uniref:Ribonuclease VapC n=1 Tax=Spirosoma radiotolerans TaxID=1379870 RepID=A0A0E3ZSW4_9BACT|nr:type II toxin-antitoxin system VapC family toxin [Spirosoma radiotolerans]AKD53725.1 twitching motility protein PilT [Spirosoma radiotolerans]